MTIDPNKSYTATFETFKSRSDCDLIAKDAPKPSTTLCSFPVQMATRRSQAVACCR
jgi:hypothetical protein